MKGPGRICTVPGCDTPIVARGLCRKHYSASRRGRLDATPTPQVGSPSGFGRFGVVDRDEDTITCHECGARLSTLWPHLAKEHGLTVAAYRRRHGLPHTVGLVSLARSRALSEQAKANIGSPGWRRLEQARDPVSASHSRQPEDLNTPAVRRWSSEQAGRLNAAARGSGAWHPCVVCGTPLQGKAKTCSKDCARVLQRDNAQRRKTPRLPDELAAQVRADQALVPTLLAQGWSRAAIAEALGRSAAWMTQHYPKNPTR